MRAGYALSTHSQGIVPDIDSSSDFDDASVGRFGDLPMARQLVGQSLSQPPSLVFSEQRRGARSYFPAKDLPTLV